MTDTTTEKYRPSNDASANTATRQSAPEWDPTKPLGRANSAAGGGASKYKNPVPGAYIAEVITVREVPREKWPQKLGKSGDPLTDDQGRPLLTPKVRLIWRFLFDEDGDPCDDDVTLGMSVTQSLHVRSHLGAIAAAMYRVQEIPEGIELTPADLFGHKVWVDVVTWTNGDRSGVMVKKDPLGVRPLTGKRADKWPAPKLPSHDEQDGLPF